MTHYVILPMNQATRSRLLDTVQKTISNCRSNSDGTKIIVKFTSDCGIPDSFSGYDLLSYEDILTELSNPEWDGDVI